MLLLLAGWVLLPLRLKYLLKKPRQVVPIWLFVMIRKNIMRLAKARALLDLVMSTNVKLSNLKRAIVKLERRVDRLQAIIRLLKRRTYGHHLKPDFLLFFKYMYKVDGLS